MNAKRILCLFILTIAVLVLVVLAGCVVDSPRTPCGLPSDYLCGDTPTAYYADTLAPLLDEYSASWDRTSQLLGDLGTSIELLSDPTWITEMGTEVDIRVMVCFHLSGLVPPPELSSSHAELLLSCADAATADDYLMAFVHDIGTNSLAQAIDYLTQSMAHLNRAAELTVSS